MRVTEAIRREFGRTPSAAPPPPLRLYQSLWRYALAFLSGSALWLAVAESQSEHAQILFFIDPALGIVALVLLRYRRRWPFPIAMISAGLTCVSVAAAGPSAIVVVSLSTRRRWREIVPTFVVSALLASWIHLLVQPEQGSSTVAELAFGIGANAIVIVIGLYIGARRDLITTLEDRAQRAETEQVERVAQAKATERNRIAREMHDVLAHRISRVAMHAGALAYRTDLDPEETRRVAEVIQTNANAALAELRGVLGLLRTAEVDLGEPQRPQPTLADIGELVAESQRNGMRVTYRCTFDPADTPPNSVGRSAYRVVQEGLTNAGKHAPRTLVEVELTRTPDDELSVRVCNRMPVGAVAAPPGSGLGLVGLAERAALAGGRLEHASTPAGDFVMQAWLPWTTPPREPGVIARPRSM